MPTNTTFLGMKLYNSTTDGSATFATWRADIDGISSFSNFNLLDTFCQNYSASIVLMQTKDIHVIPAIYISSNYYEANGISGLTSLTNDMLIDLYLDTTNVGTVTLNINSLGTKTLKKVDASGNYVDLDSGDLLKSKENLFRYTGTYFIWIGQSSGGVSAISGSGIMSDTSGSVVKHNVSGVSAGTYLAANITVDNKGHITAATNGTSASSVGAPSDSPFLTTGSSTSLTNYSVLTAGSYVSIVRSGSTTTIGTTVVPITTMTGSSVMSTSSGSVIKHNYSGVVAGSANKIQFDNFGHIVSASVIPVPQTATLTAGQALQTYDSTTGVFEKVSIPSTAGSVAGYSLGGYDASSGSFVMVPSSSGGRELLTANRTYYVRTDGNDSNTGLVDSSGGAFLTIQKAVDTVAGLDKGIYNVTIQVRDGTYTDTVILKNTIGAGAAIIQGNTTTPANCIISTTSNSCFFGQNAGYWIIKGFKVETTTSGNCIYAIGSTEILVYNIEFGACASFHMNASRRGQITVQTIYTISGGAIYHMITDQMGFISNSNFSHVISGTCAFNSFVRTDIAGGIYSRGCTWAGGTVTGKRHRATLLSWIYTNGGGENYFPGDAAGDTPTTGAQYN